MSSHNNSPGRLRRQLAPWLTLLLLSGCSLPPLASQPMPTAPPVGTGPAGRPVPPLPPGAVATAIAADQRVRQATQEAPVTSEPPVTTDALEEPRQLTSRPAPRSGLVVDGNYVAWTSYEDDRTNIVVYDLTMGEERRISSLPGEKSKPHLQGQYVVWEEHYQSPDHPYFAEIHGYDLASGRETVLGDGILRDVSGETAVWYDPADKDHPTVVYDLASGQSYRPPQVPGVPVKVSGEWLLYGQPIPESPFGAELTALNLKTQEEIMLGRLAVARDTRPDYAYEISDRWVVWQGTAPHDKQVEMRVYDLESHQGRKLDEPRALYRFQLAQGILLDGARVYNLNHPNVSMQIFRPGPQYQVTDLVHDGQTVAWIAGPREQGQVYVARFRRVP